MEKGQGEGFQSDLRERGEAANAASAASLRAIENFKSEDNPFKIASELIFYLREVDIHGQSQGNEDLAVRRTPETRLSILRAEEKQKNIQDFTEMLDRAKFGSYVLIGEYVSARGVDITQDIKQGQRLTPQQRLGRGLSAIGEKIAEANGVGDPFKEPISAWRDPRFNPQAPPPPQKS